MSSDSHGLRNAIIATVAGGLILSFVSWLLGFLPTVWAWIESLAEAAWNFVIADSHTPVWLLLVVIGFAIPTVLKFVMQRFNRRSATEPSRFSDSIDNRAMHADGSTKQTTKPEFSELEGSILRVLAAVDGRSLRLDSIADRIKSNRLRTKQALESLVEKDLVEEAHNYVHGTSYYLSAYGRDLVIDLDYA